MTKKYYVLKTTDAYFNAIVKANTKKEAINDFYIYINNYINAKQKEDRYCKCEIECFILEKLFKEFNSNTILI